MEFEVQTNYTIEDFAAYWLGFRWKSPGKKPPRQASRRARKIAAWILLLGGGAVAALGLWPRPMSDPMITCMGLLFLAVGVFAVIRPVPEYPYWVQRAWKNYQKRGVNFTCRFTEKGFEIHTGTSDHRYDYPLLQHLWADEGHFYIFLDQRVPYILSKTSFTQGTPAAFAAFLAERTGKLVKWVNGERPF